MTTMVYPISARDKLTTDLLPQSYFFDGSTEVERGTGFCKNAAYVGDGLTEDQPERSAYIYKPTQDNAVGFMGVALGSQKAMAKGQMVPLARPGSICRIALLANVTAGDIVGCLAGGAGAGRFWKSGCKGPGAAKILTTVSDVVKEEDLTGASYINTDGKTLIDSAATFVSGTYPVAVGDRVFFLGIEYDGTNGAIDEDGYSTTDHETLSATNKIMSTEAAVASITNDTTLVLDRKVTDGGTMQCSYVIIRGNPTTEAELLGGDERLDCGMVEAIMPRNAGHATNDTMVVMPLGKTYLLGGITLTTNNARETLPNGKVIGQRKAFECLGALVGYDIEIKLATAGTQITGSSISTIRFDQASEKVSVTYEGVWHEQYHSGATIA